MRHTGTSKGQKQGRLHKPFKLKGKGQKTTEPHCSFGSTMNKETRTVLLSEEREKYARRKPKALKKVRSRTLRG